MCNIWPYRFKYFLFLIFLQGLPIKPVQNRKKYFLNRPQKASIVIDSHIGDTPWTEKWLLSSAIRIPSIKEGSNLNKLKLIDILELVQGTEESGHS
jgi:hypothetical protein